MSFATLYPDPISRMVHRFRAHRSDGGKARVHLQETSISNTQIPSMAGMENEPAVQVPICWDDPIQWLSFVNLSFPVLRYRMSRVLAGRTLFYFREKNSYMWVARECVYEKDPHSRQGFEVMELLDGLDSLYRCSRERDSIGKYLPGYDATRAKK